MLKLGQRFRERKTNPVKSGMALIGESYLVDNTPYSGAPGMHQDPRIYRMSDLGGNDVIYLTDERCMDYVNSGPPYLAGNDFTLMKAVVQDLKVQGIGKYAATQDNNYAHYCYDGGFVFRGGSIGTAPPLSDYSRHGEFTDADAAYIPDLSAYGPTVYNSMRPKPEKAGIAQMIGEARDFMPMMKQTSKGFHDLWNSLGGKANVMKGLRDKPFMAPKRAADEFLGVQFGWKPFIQDFAQVIDAYQNSTKYMDQIRHDNNVWKKRYRVVEDTEDVSELGRSTAWLVYPADIRLSYCCEIINDSTCLTTFTGKHSMRVWGVGQFKYYRPEFDASLANYANAFTAAQRYMTLYGANVNPSVLYKVTPWTWLGDWFTNVGATISNATAMETDALVSKYAFVMARQTDEVQIQTELYLKPGHAVCNWSRLIETKHRETCSPFGFGLRPGDLSGKQLAILAALGLSKSL